MSNDVISNLWVVDKARREELILVDEISAKVDKISGLLFDYDELEISENARPIVWTCILLHFFKMWIIRFNLVVLHQL